MRKYKVLVNVYKKTCTTIEVLIPANTKEEAIKEASESPTDYEILDEFPTELVVGVEYEPATIEEVQ